jgi:Rrf2 family protein
MLSKKAKYAIKAVLYIAKQHDRGTPVFSAEIADAERIPRKFLEAILRDLKNAGILSSQRGRGGGYFLQKPANEITLAEIMRLCDGPIAMLPCVSEKFYRPCAECVNEAKCAIHIVFHQIRSTTFSILMNATIEKMNNIFPEEA